MAKKILVFDDDELLAETLCNLITAEGYPCKHCQLSHEFFDQCYNWNPELVILDLNLADSDGISILRWIADICPETAVILISGTDQRVLDAAARTADTLNLKLYGNLTKPFYPHELIVLLHPETDRQTSSVSKPASIIKTFGPTAEAIEQGLKNREFFLAFQPKVDCASGMLVGAEALARWYSPGVGTIPPNVFIPVAEKYGLIGKLTDYLLDLALLWLQRNLSDLPHNKQRKFHLAINLSASLLGDLSLVDKLRQKCLCFEVEPENIHLEITESAMLEDPLICSELLTQLRLLGFEISIDDFGTGYSSLMQLARQPFTELKIDKGFIQSLCNHGEIYQIVQATIRMAHSLGLWVTAEGVEDEAVLQLLQQLKCDTVQGYHIARPMSEQAFSEWITHLSQQPEYKCFRPGPVERTSKEPLARLSRLLCRLLKLPVCVVATFQDGHCFARTRVGIRSFEFSIDEATFLKCFGTKQILVKNNIAEQNDEAYQLFNLPYNFDFMAVYPLWSHNGFLIGSLWLASRSVQTLTQRQQNMAEEVAQIVSDELSARTDFHIDSQTQLKSRYGFETCAQQLLNFANQHELNLCLITFWLNSEADVTEKRLKLFSNCLKQCFCEADLLGRTDMQEFSALLIDFPINHIEAMQQKLQALTQHKSEKHQISLSFKSRLINHCDNIVPMLHHLYLLSPESE